jgi:hypothetical protein
LLLGACGAPEDQDDATAIAEAQRFCSSGSPQVCGSDGLTYANVCRAGGISRVAHFGACSSACGNTSCIIGYHCKTTTVFGAPVSSCVPDDPTIQPDCTCDAGSHCEQLASGALTCVQNALPTPAPTCATIRCEAGTHCKTVTVYGAPVSACVAD